MPDVIPKPGDIWVDKDKRSDRHVLVLDPEPGQRKDVVRYVTVVPSRDEPAVMVFKRRSRFIRADRDAFTKSFTKKSS